MVINALKRAITSYRDKKKKLKGRLNSRQQLMLRAALFLLRFTILVLPLHFLLWANWNVYVLQKLLAGSVAFFLKTIGLEVVQDYQFLVFAEFGPVEIVKDCLAWKSMLALFGLIFAVQGLGVTKKIKGWLIGIVLIVLGNYLRLVSTFYAVVVWNLDFQIVHSLLWRWGLMLLILGYWMLWLRRSRAKLARKQTDKETN